ncbi:WxL domain-containing protein [Leifsonia poae]|uniref:WxL domain-containing protein n=1 Tax=Leifsonia poae TaxID=110933 RepID=UPI001CBDE59A|nr:WxL domain-containing protein [Leifsonia poae]
MTMRTNRIVTLALAGAAAVALSVGTSSAAFAVAQPNGSESGLYLFDNDAQEWVADGATIAWDTDILISPSKTDPFATLQCPADATNWRSFIAPSGSERTIADWKAFSHAPFGTPAKQVLGVDTTPQQQISGSTASVKANGGDFSFGVACVKDNGVNLASSGLWYFTGHVAKNGSGNYTFDSASTGPSTPTDPAGTGSIGIEATTITAADGALSLVVPTAAKATLGAATLVDKLSTSTGELPAFQVADRRVVSTPGWDLTASTAAFVNSADSAKTIDALQLGVKPKVVSSTATGVSLGAEHKAGDATPFSAFASAPAGSGAGDTNLSADLTLVAPANTPAGTYTSTMTLTLVSK